MFTRKILFLTGMPNSGKSTASFYLVHEGWAQYVVMPGTWLRNNAKRDTDLGHYIANNWNNEALEPLVMQHVDEMLNAFFQREQGTERNAVVIVEGYPRTAAEAEHCIQWAQRFPSLIIELEVSAAEAKRRSKKRTRDDDNDASFLKRCEHWKEESAAVLRKCDECKLLLRLSTDEREPEELVAAIGALLEQTKKVLNEVPPPPLSQNDAVPPPSTFMERASAEETAVVVQMQLRLAGAPNRKRQFAGAHPVSLDRENMPRLRRYPYLCALKVDGERLFCVVHARRLYFVNRRMQVWRLRDERDEWLEDLAPFENSLLDGELTLNNLFIVLDVLSVRGVNVTQKPIIERLAASVPLGRLFYQAPLRFRPQEYVDRTQLSLLLARAPHSDLRYDGVIFQPAKLPYRVGIDYNLFKWKPAHENTADLLYRCDDGGQLFCRNSNSQVTEALLPVPEGSSLHEDYRHTQWLEDGKVVECGLMRGGDNNTLKWVPKKPRWDKLFPNLDWVVRKIIQSVRDNITEVELIEYCRNESLKPHQVPSPPRVRRNQPQPPRK